MQNLSLKTIGTHHGDIKALYSLRTFGLRCNERFAEFLPRMGLKRFKAEPDTWFNRCKFNYNYISV